MPAGYAVPAPAEVDLGAVVRKGEVEVVAALAVALGSNAAPTRDKGLVIPSTTRSAKSADLAS